MKTIIYFFVAFGTAAVLSSCEYEAITPDVDLNDTTTVIGFADKIQPIFTNNCVACHKPGFFLDLSEGHAYDDLNVPKYINRDTPSLSLIYTKQTTSSHQGVYSRANAALVLRWIEQGALNN